MKLFATLVAAVAMSACAATAQAQTEVKLDVNSMVLSTSGGGAFGGTSHTGTLDIGMDGDTQLFGIQIDNGVNMLGAPMAVSSLTGSLTLVGGTVTGGSFTLVVGADSYTATVVGGSGSVNSQAGQGFTIDGLTFSGMFSSGSFAGVDVSPWFSAQPLGGAFINLFYNPDGSGVDATTDMDITAVVPVPTAAGLACVGLAGLATRRRRA